MTTNHFFGGWGGVCALGKRKKKKKGKHGGRSVSGQNPVWRVYVGGGALLCERNIGVWCSYKTCNVSSSLFYWLQQLICYPLYKLCIYKYNTMVTFPYKTKVMHGLGNFLLFHF